MTNNQQLAAKERAELVRQLKNAIADMTSYINISPEPKDAGDVNFNIRVYQIALASLEAEPIGKVNRGHVSDCNDYPDARVQCLHDQADWENFQDGFLLYNAPPVAVMQPVVLPAKRRIPTTKGHSLKVTHIEMYHPEEVHEAIRAAGGSVKE